MHQRQQAGCDVEDENPSNDDGGGCDDKDARGYQGFDRRRVCDSSGARLAMMEHFDACSVGCSACFWSAPP